MPTPTKTGPPAQLEAEPQLPRRRRCACAGLVKGSFRGIEVLTRGVSPRIVSAARARLARSHDRSPAPQLAGAPRACRAPGPTSACARAGHVQRRARPQRPRPRRSRAAAHRPGDADRAAGRLAGAGRRRRRPRAPPPAARRPNRPAPYAAADARAAARRRRPLAALPLVLRAAQIDHRRATASRSTRCWGRSNVLVSLLESPPPSGRPRAVVACIGRRGGRLPRRAVPALPRPPRPDAAELAAQWRKAPALLEASAGACRDSEELEADDVMFSVARAEQDRGGRGAAADRRPRPVPGGERARGGARAATRARRRSRSARSRCASATASPRSRSPDFIALRGDPSDGLPGAPGIGAKTAAELLREHGSLEALLAAANAPLPPLRPRLAACCCENERAAARLQGDRDAAADRRWTPPAERETDFAAGARARARAGHAPPRRAPGEARYGVNLTVITSPSAIT